MYQPIKLNRLGLPTTEALLKMTSEIEVELQIPNNKPQKITIHPPSWADKRFAKSLPQKEDKKNLQGSFKGNVMWRAAYIASYNEEVENDKKINLDKIVSSPWRGDSYRSFTGRK